MRPMGVAGSWDFSTSVNSAVIAAWRVPALSIWKLRVEGVVGKGEKVAVRADCQVAVPFT